MFKRELFILGSFDIIRVAPISSITFFRSAYPYLLELGFVQTGPSGRILPVGLAINSVVKKGWPGWGRAPRRPNFAEAEPACMRLHVGWLPIDDEFNKSDIPEICTNIHNLTYVLWWTIWDLICVCFWIPHVTVSATATQASLQGKSESQPKK